MIVKSYPLNISKKQIFLLSIPVFFSNIAIPLVGIIDAGLMGNLGETKYLAATSIATSVFTMIIWSFGFLRMGTAGLVAQLLGKRDYREITKTLIRNLLVAVIASIIIIMFKPIILKLTEYYFLASQETLELIKTYMSIRILSVPAELILYILIGFYFGIQKTGISSLLTITLSSLNIIFSSFFVLSLNLNVFGVALGTLIASYITAILFITYTYFYIIKKFQVIPKFEKIIVPSKLLRLFKINFDIFFRTLFLTFSFLWITFLGSKLGEDYLAVNAILMQFIVLAAFFLDAYAFSTEGVVGYTIGRKNKKAFLTVVKNSIELSFFTSLIVSLFFLIFFKQMINLMTDIEILRYISYQHIIWILIIPTAASFCYQLDGIFVGATQTAEMKYAMFFSVILFIPLSIYLTEIFKNNGLWLSFLLFTIFRSISLNHFFYKIIKRF